LIAASSTQQALTPAGAGPPQQLALGVFRGSFEFIVCFVFMVILPSRARGPPPAQTEAAPEGRMPDDP
jgi:hypothetical protein